MLPQTRKSYFVHMWCKEAQCHPAPLRCCYSIITLSSPHRTATIHHRSAQFPRRCLSTDKHVPHTHPHTRTHIEHRPDNYGVKIIAACGGRLFRDPHRRYGACALRAEMLSGEYCINEVANAYCRVLFPTSLVKTVCFYNWFVLIVHLAYASWALAHWLG